MRSIRTEQRVRIAVIGCGAVAEKRYLPAAPLVPEIRVTHLVDMDLDRARALAGEFGIPNAAADWREILADVDAVVVATPPRTHAAIAIGCLSRGCPVLCEKPLATTVEEGRAMLEASWESGSLLSVGMIWRFGRSAGLLRRFVRFGLVGRIERIEAEGGGAFNWPLRTGGIFLDPEQGGVLRDTGTHVIDLVQWVVDGRASRVIDYRDDSWGGPEANAIAAFEVETRDGVVPARVEVSFTRDLDGSLRVYGEKGRLSASTPGGDGVRLMPIGGEPVMIRPEEGGARSRVEDFSVQLSQFATAVRTGGPPPVPAEEALATLAIVDACYGMRRMNVREWERAPDRTDTMMARLGG